MGYQGTIICGSNGRRAALPAKSIVGTTVGTTCEIDAKAMAFTVGIQWCYSGLTVYLQCVHCKIIQCRELLTPLPL